MPPNRAVREGRSVAGYTYPKGRLLPSCFGLRKFPVFKKPKQALINAFIICLQSQSLNFALQSYNIFLNYANLFGVKVSYRVDAEFLSYSMYCT